MKLDKDGDESSELSFSLDQLAELMDSSDIIDFESQEFSNSLFTVEFYKKKPNYSADLELKLSPPMDKFNMPIYDDFVECPIDFKVTVVGNWAIQLWVEKGDTVRIIGNFCKENKFHLRIDDNSTEELSDDQKLKKASLIIVEPHILIPTTQIVKAFPCARKSYISKQFTGSPGDINYALVLGNVIHEIF